MSARINRLIGGTALIFLLVGSGCRPQQQAVQSSPDTYEKRKDCATRGEQIKTEGAAQFQANMKSMLEGQKNEGRIAYPLIAENYGSPGTVFYSPKLDRCVYTIWTDVHKSESEEVEWQTVKDAYSQEVLLQTENYQVPLDCQVRMENLGGEHLKPCSEAHKAFFEKFDKEVQDLK